MIDFITCPYCGNKQFVQQIRVVTECRKCHKTIHLKKTVPSISLASTPVQQETAIVTPNNPGINIASADRPYGVVLLGQTGFGKTSLLEHLAAADIGNTTSIIFDPHGELSERMLRIGAGINPQNLLFCEITGNMSYGFNPLEVQNPGDPLEESQTIDSLMQVFRKHWSNNPGYTFGPRVEWVLSNTARTILANPGYTLAEIPLLLHDKAFRDKLVRNVTNPQVQFFWGEYRQLESTRRPLDTWQMVESTVTRLTQFLANEWLYRVLYQAKGTINFHELINSNKTIIFSLPIGKLGEEPAALLGSLLLGKLVTTIFSRNEYGKTYPRLHVYIDEYSRFAVPITSALLTQGRKFNVGTTITLQTLAQIPDEENKAAILQTGNLIAFQCIGSDAEIVAKQMPLPDPVGLMKPEPVLLYSQSAVEDIWNKGHPHESVIAVRDKYFWIVGELKRKPQQEFWIYDPTALLREHPGWGRPEVVNLWDSYRSSSDMLREGIAFLDQYYYNCMQHEYIWNKAATPEVIQLVQKILQCFSGFFGWGGTMRPIMTIEKQDFLAHRLQEYLDHIGERYFDHKPERYRDVPIHEEVPWPFEELRSKHQKLLSDLRNHNLTDSVDFPEKIIQVAIEVGISPYEADKLIEWVISPHMDLSAYLGPDPKIKEIQDCFNDIHYEIPSEIPASAKEYALTRPGIQEQLELTIWQAQQRVAFIKYALFMCGLLLEKEPLFAPSHSYHDVEMNRRTYSDLRDELVTKLVSLPPYNAICTLASKSGDLPFQILTPKPLTIRSEAEAKAREVREESRRELGHPWQEVAKDIQTRQNLPPAKPQI